MNRSDLKQFLAKEYGLKPIQQEPTPPLFEEAKEALIKRFAEIAGGFNRPDYYKDITSAPKILGSLYIQLKSEVCFKLANEKYPEKDEKYIFTLSQWRHSGVFEQGSHEGMAWVYYGTLEFGNRCASNYFEIHMRTKFFEGDITLEEMK